MSKFTALCFGVAFAGLATAYACSRIRFESQQNAVVAPILIEGPQKHLVTPKMLTASAAMTNSAAPGFRARATDLNTYDLSELTKTKPVVLIFIKNGCPCSVAAQPFFNRLFATYGNYARFFGVFDGDLNTALRWAKKNDAEFPILIDPEMQAVKDYKAESSAYVALIASGGRVEKLWPGYSADMLNDAGERIARLAGKSMVPIDLSDAPTEMTAGCPY